VKSGKKQNETATKQSLEGEDRTGKKGGAGDTRNKGPLRQTPIAEGNGLRWVHTAVLHRQGAGIDLRWVHAAVLHRQRLDLQG
jgi:hypothetical protein